MCVFRHYAAVIATSLLLVPSLTTEVRAQAYPIKPVRMVLPFPAGAPSDIVGRTIGQRLSEEVFKALESREMRQRMDAMSINPWPGTPEQMGELLRKETARYAAIIKSAGLRTQ